MYICMCVCVCVCVYVRVSVEFGGSCLDLLRRVSFASWDGVAAFQSDFGSPKRPVSVCLQNQEKTIHVHVHREVRFFVFLY